jgi:hypothetical protein
VPTEEEEEANIESLTIKLQEESLPQRLLPSFEHSFVDFYDMGKKLIKGEITLFQLHKTFLLTTSDFISCTHKHAQTHKEY